MTPVSTIFVKYEASKNKQHVQIADGTLLPEAGIGSINLAPIGLLTRVLHVPKLFVSFVSVRRIANLDEYKILFDNFDAFLGNNVHGWKIGLARVYHGLYYIPCLSPNNDRGVIPRKQQ